MKFINKSLLAAALALVGFTFNSCDDGDAVIDEVFANTTSGIVLRTVNVESDELPIGQSDSYFAVELEMQDEEDGALVESLDVYVSFKDNTIEEGGTDFSAAEVQVGTVSSSEFTIGEYGFPRYSYSITLPEMLSTLSVSESNLDGGDVFSIRFAANLVDGRTFSNGQNTDTSTGSFFASPFQYNATVVCPPSTPTAGTWEVYTADSYGDGWNGGVLTVVLDGTDTLEFVNTDGGLPDPGLVEQSFSFEVPEGTETISIVYTGGAYDSEVTFTVTSANGNVVIDAGPEPITDFELLNYCLNNL
ncbi:MAG: hypothetical protein H2058_15740 [Muricauda sp.]|nr:hypothetical protein [Allomuricauda sp.]MBA4746701.1 hypothetical protein [Allomuricauda sp.]